MAGDAAAEVREDVSAMAAALGTAALSPNPGGAVQRAKDVRAVQAVVHTLAALGIKHVTLAHSHDQKGIRDTHYTS